MGILGDIGGFVSDLFGGGSNVVENDFIGPLLESQTRESGFGDFLSELFTDEAFGSATDAASTGGFLSSMAAGDFLTPALAAISQLGLAEMRREDPRLTAAKINQIEQTLEIERQRLALAQQKQGFDAELQKKQIEIQLAMAALDAAKKGVADRTQEIQAIQQGAGQRTQDTGQVLRALESITAGAQRGVK